MDFEKNYFTALSAVNVQ